MSAALVRCIKTHKRRLCAGMGQAGIVPTDPFMMLVAPDERFEAAAGFATSNFCDDRNVSIATIMRHGTAYLQLPGPEYPTRKVGTCLRAQGKGPQKAEGLLLAHHSKLPRLSSDTV